MVVLFNVLFELSIELFSSLISENCGIVLDLINPLILLMINTVSTEIFKRKRESKSKSQIYLIKHYFLNF